VTKKMKILIPIIVIVLLGILAVNVYFSLLIEEKEPWRSLKETPSPTQQE
jgi:flagellar basal body-associated protein FliL